MRCSQHYPRQHRDGKPPWCRNCGLTKDFQVPKSLFKKEKPVYKEPMAWAQKHVRDYIDENLEKTDVRPDYDTYVVWFCYILGGWKALISTTLPDGMYYEVTYNKNQKTTYLDAYKKFHNREIPD